FQGEDTSGVSGLGRGGAGVPGAEVQPFELRQSVPADPAVAVAGALQPTIVDADQVTVTGEADVTLDPVGAVLQRPKVRRKSVLGKSLGGSPVGKHERLS